MPTIYVIAGPNGIGKTTSSYDLVPANTPIINSDEIAKEVRNAGIISLNTQEYSKGIAFIAVTLSELITYFILDLHNGQ